MSRTADPREVASHGCVRAVRPARWRSRSVGSPHQFCARAATRTARCGGAVRRITRRGTESAPGTKHRRRPRRSTAVRQVAYLPNLRRWTRVLRRSLRCFFLDMRLRRFLMTEPMRKSFAVVGNSNVHVPVRTRALAPGTTDVPAYPSAGRSLTTRSAKPSALRAPPTSTRAVVGVLQVGVHVALRHAERATDPRRR